MNKGMIAALALIGAAGLTDRAVAQDDFFRGKSMTMIVGTTAGNDYDFRARLLARFMGQHIPGEPQIVVRNMPGGGGIVASNWMAKVAPRDGTVLMAIMQPNSVNQALGLGQIQYDVREFGWIGNTSDTPNVVTAWHEAGVQTVEDARKKELLIGGTVGTLSVIYPRLLNELAGTKFKIVTGYPGGNQINIAMESGEVQGRGANSWSAWKSTRPHWLAEKKIHILVQVALKRAPDLPDVPTMIELASNEFDRKVMTFLSADTAIARAIVTTPGVPPERLAMLRRAFEAAMKNSDLRAEAAKQKMEISVLSGEEAQKIAASIVEADPKVVERARQIIGVPGK
jgi:tripartite-type tricarboxylate transporter receptor subunit TctC